MYAANLQIRNARKKISTDKYSRIRDSKKIIFHAEINKFSSRSEIFTTRRRWFILSSPIKRRRAFIIISVIYYSRFAKIVSLYYDEIFWHSVCHTCVPFLRSAVRTFPVLLKDFSRILPIQRRIYEISPQFHASDACANIGANLVNAMARATPPIKFITII